MNVYICEFVFFCQLPILMSVALIIYFMNPANFLWRRIAASSDLWYLIVKSKGTSTGPQLQRTDKQIKLFVLIILFPHGRHLQVRLNSHQSLGSTPVAGEVGDDDTRNVCFCARFVLNPFSRSIYNPTEFHFTPNLLGPKSWVFQVWPKPITGVKLSPDSRPQDLTNLHVRGSRPLSPIVWYTKPNQSLLAKQFQLNGKTRTLPN